MKTFLILLVLLVLSRIETNEATRNLDETHLLLPSLHTRPPVKTPAPDPRTEANVNMASKFNERNYFVGRKEVVFAPPPPTNAYPLDKTHFLLPSLQTCPPVKTPSPNSGSETSVNMASTVTERNFLGRKEVVFATPPPTNVYPFDKTHLLLPSLQTCPPIKTPSPNPGSENSVNMASTVTERNFVGRREVSFAPPPPTNAYPLDKTHFLLPSLQTRPPVKTPSPNPGSETGVNMASTVTERNFVGRKEVVFAPPPPTNAYPLDKTYFLLPSLQTRPPVKTPSPNPGSETSVNMASMVTERNFVGRRKKVFFAPPPPSNENPLDKTRLLLPFLQTRAPVKTPSPNPGRETSVNMASTVTERNFVGCKEVVFAPLPPTNAYPLDKTHFLLLFLQTRPPVKTPSPNPGSETSVNMASTVTERNFLGRKEVVFAPTPPTNAYPLDKTHFLLPSFQTRPPVKTPSPNPGSETSVNMASTISERNFVGRRKEVVFAPPPPSNANPPDKTHLLLPFLQTRAPVKTPSPNPGSETSVNMASTVTERNFVGRKEVVFAPSPPTNAYPLDKTHFLLPSLQTRPPVKTPSPNPGSETSVNMASTVTKRNFVGRKEVGFAPPPPLPSTNAYPQNNVLFDVSIATTQK
ncbi:uncharacterized protein LOC125807803 [Solanum verrucosum]|uniref:uncharacterized protein LOC125807803 n=1 Tax=Solanum verrucosum TaxID=315347 RepID=UPI0020D0655F|nr:uncharacterized protein LOC125807803 [Solanum verrucosum]